MLLNSFDAAATEMRSLKEKSGEKKGMHPGAAIEGNPEGKEHALPIAQFVKTTLCGEVAFPVGAVSGASGHGAEEKRVDFDDLLDRARACCRIKRMKFFQGTKSDETGHNTEIFLRS